MSVPPFLTKLTGDWEGTNRLWLSPNESARESATIASIALIAQGQFVSIRYTWAFEGTPQDGWIVIGQKKSEDTLQSVWIDSWHMQDQFMLCQGTAAEDESMMVGGKYAAPPGPDWGWWIVIEAKVAGSWRLVMHNVPPGGEAVLAVEAAYTRKEAPV